MENSDTSAQSNYALLLANESYEWYRTAAIRSRRAYRVSETLLLLVASAIPLAAAVLRDNAILPALLGALVVVISGVRSLFNWRDNYIRFSWSREAVERERRKYLTSTEPYTDPDVRDKALAAAITSIESEEMTQWLAIANKTGGDSSR
jgi:hypothetical protein